MAARSKSCDRKSRTNGYSVHLPGKHRSHQLIRGVPQSVVDPFGFADRDDIADQRSDLYRPPGDQAARIV